MRRWMAPGRVNIIGEHTDYNDGWVLPVALSVGVVCATAPRPDRLVRLTSAQRPGEVVEIAVDELAAQRDRLPRWARYPLGVVREFVLRGYAVGGVRLAVDGAVPVGAGLSSSAALCCAVTLALRDLYAPELGERAMIEIAAAAENRYAGVPTGLLDQSASILCTTGHALLLDVRAFAATDNVDHRAAEQIPFDPAAHELALLVADTGQPHDLADGGYARRRAQCESAAAALDVAALRDATPDDLTRLTDDVLRRRATHVVSENARVLAVADRLRTGADPRSIGPLLTASHESLRHDFDVSTPALDLAVHTALDAGAHGARMIGGGFGGSVLALVDSTATDRVRRRIAEGFAEAGLAAPHVFTVEPAAGARRLE